MFALFTYGLMPTVQATLTGWREIDADVRRAAEGMGMGPWRQLLTVELPWRCLACWPASAPV
jgi:osmoprotectant transport system permease protein